MFTNSIKVAIERVGGATRAANELRVSPVTIYDWIKKQRVANLDKALQLAKLSHVPVGDLRPARRLAML